MSSTKQPEIVVDEDDDDPLEEEDMTLDDALDLIEELSEEVNVAQQKLASVERGVNTMMTGIIVLLGDVSIALSSATSPEGKQAAVTRIQAVVAALQKQMKMKTGA